MDPILKFAHVEKQVISDADLQRIHAQTMRPLASEEVFTFRVVACDNQVDRDYERFSNGTLVDLARLFAGRTVLCDHKWSAEAQTARIYDAEVEQNGELHRLILRCYMLRTEATQENILAIEGGILREVSVACQTERALCSICATNRHETYCPHIPGKDYEGETCHIMLDGAKDAFEVSFVAVPAQPGAGVIKQYGGVGEPQNHVSEVDAQRLAEARQVLEEKRYGGFLS